MRANPFGQADLRTLRVGIAVFGVTSALALAGMVVKAIEMVQDGRGMETHRTFWLAEDNWIGFLVFVVGLLIALLLGAALRWRERRQWRDLEEKYVEGARNT